MDVGITRLRSRRAPEEVHADLLLLAVVLAENCFGLIDADAINIAGVLNIDLVWQALLLVMSIYLYAKSLRVPGTKTSAVQGVLFSALIVMCFVAAWRCLYLTGQPFVRGILPQRGFMVCILAAILLRRPFKAGLVDGRRLIDGVILLGIIASCLYLLQAAVGSVITFVHVGTGERYGGSRLYVDNALSITAGIFGMWQFIKTNKLKPLLASVLALLCLLFVSKGRLELGTYLFVIVFIFLFIRGFASTKALLLSFAFLGIILFLQTGYASQVIDEYRNGFNGTQINVTIRESGREYYDAVLRGTDMGLLLGCGYPSTLWPPATNMAGYSYAYYLVDNGIYGFRYVYGDLGVFLAILCLITIVKTIISNTTLNKSSKVTLLGYWIFMALPFVNMASWWVPSSWQPLTALIAAMCWLGSQGGHLPKSSDERFISYDDEDSHNEY